MARKPKTSKGGGASKFDENKHERGPGGKFANKPGAGDDAPKKGKKPLVGETALKTSGVTGDDRIVAISTRLRSYKDGQTVREFVDGHPKGRAYALRKLAADQKKGVIGFKGAAQAPKPAPAQEKYDPNNYSDFDNTDKQTVLEVERDLYKTMLGDTETAAEIQSIKRYSGYEYTQINGYLRSRAVNKGKDDPTKHPSLGTVIRNIDGVLSRSRMAEDTVVYRGLTGKFAQKVRGLKPGAMIDEPGYVSTSLKSQASKNFAGTEGVVLKLMLPKGNSAYIMNGRGASQYASEHEVLLPRNSKFRIREIQGNVILAEVL